MAENFPRPIGADKFLIAGCQRSGTTLTAMALEAHPLIEIVEENDRRLHIPGDITRELDLETALCQSAGPGRMIGYKAPRETHRLTEIRRTMPGVRIIWVERDIRQTVSSMLSLVSDGTSWAEVFAPREIRKHIDMTGDTVARRLFARTNAFENPRDRAVALAALCWHVKRAQGVEAASRHAMYWMQIGYDDLTSSPGVALGTLLDFLDLPWNPNVLDHPASIMQAVRPGGADTNRPIDESSREKWKGQLLQADLDLMRRVERAFDRGGNWD